MNTKKTIAIPSINILILLIIIYSCDFKDVSSDPNFIIIYTDDQRADAMGYVNPDVYSPNLDKLSSQGVKFTNAFVTLSICSPSRACLLTGRYPSANGVTTFGDVALYRGEKTMAQFLKERGYQTAMIGKWHLKDTPEELGFDFATYFKSNGPWYDRKISKNGHDAVADGFIEKYIVDESIDYIDSVRQINQPFFLSHCTQVPHLNNEFEWDVKEKTIKKHYSEMLELPANWQDDLLAKPDYLQNGRHRTRAIQYGYRDGDTLVAETKRYFAAITEMDAQLGRLFEYLKNNKLMDNTYIVIMGDNGWFIGDHLFTSKVLAYEESIRVPAFIVGPGIEAGWRSQMILNADILPTVLELVNMEIPENIHGSSLVPILNKNEQVNWRDTIFYEAPESQLGSWPLYAIRTSKLKYIETYDPNNRDTLVFQELYNLEDDPWELDNIAKDKGNENLLNQFKSKADYYRNQFNR